MTEWEYKERPIRVALILEPHYVWRRLPAELERCLIDQVRLSGLRFATATADSDDRSDFADGAFGVPGQDPALPFAERTRQAR